MQVSPSIFEIFEKHYPTTPRTLSKIQWDNLLGVAASEPPEAHVHGLEHFVHYGLVGDACGGGVVALNGRGGLRPAHFDESVP